MPKNLFDPPLDQHVWGALAPQGDLRSKMAQNKMLYFTSFGPTHLGGPWHLRETSVKKNYKEQKVLRI